MMATATILCNGSVGADMKMKILVNKKSHVILRRKRKRGNDDDELTAKTSSNQTLDDRR
jgi:hypothetical protein